VSGAFDRPIPAAIPPLTENPHCLYRIEWKVLCWAGQSPLLLSQHSGPAHRAQQWEDGFYWGIKSRKKAKAATEKGSLVVDLTASGWSPKPGNIKKVAEVLKNLNLKPCDTIVINAMANSAYFGTDENGLPMPPAKSGKDGRHHMIGDLQLAPTAVF
jgi:hypothetical protein